MSDGCGASRASVRSALDVRCCRPGCGTGCARKAGTVSRTRWPMPWQALSWLVVHRSQSWFEQALAYCGQPACETLKPWRTPCLSDAATLRAQPTVIPAPHKVERNRFRKSPTRWVLLGFGYTTQG